VGDEKMIFLFVFHWFGKITSSDRLNDTMNGDKHIAKENDKMDKIKEEINQVFEGKLKTKLEYATNEFPEDFDRIYNQSTKAFETKYEPYPYQKQASVLIDSIYGEHRECPQSNILIASPTGSGKTFAIKWAAYRALKNGERLLTTMMSMMIIIRHRT